MPHEPAGESRRAFLKDLAVLGVGSWALGACASSGSASGISAAVRPSVDRIGLQLFTVRDQMTADFDGTLAKVAAIGYREVEPVGYGNRTPTQVRATLDRLGLSAPSTHVALRAGPELERTLAGYQEMGHKFAAASGPRPPGGFGGPPAAGAPRPPAPPPQTLDSVRRSLDEYNTIAAAAKPYGIRVLVHNHTMEFQPLADGRTPFEVMIAELDPERVVLELDIGWATVAGKNALDLFAKYPGRFPLWHVKDMAGLAALQGMANQGERQRAAKIVAVGQGEIDYRPMFARAASSGMQHFFVEQDTAPNSGDSIAAARVSFDAVRRVIAG